ncbi:ABC transporter permease subunit [Streptomyces rochei]|uniref:ABC transporter permease subunit n=1 Tax=Streptomyces rochei TaxID=1928 RepID=UPI0036B9CA75
MVRVTEGALTAVPKELKEASLALGVSRWHTVNTVLIPSAIPSILTGAILASGRGPGAPAFSLRRCGGAAGEPSGAYRSSFGGVRSPSTFSVRTSSPHTTYRYRLV